MEVYKILTWVALLLGTVGVVLFLVYKSQGKSKNMSLGYVAKGSISVGIYLLAFAILSMQNILT